jgi:hypothetical protein
MDLVLKIDNFSTTEGGVFKANLNFTKSKILIK